MHSHTVERAFHLIKPTGERHLGQGGCVETALRAHDVEVVISVMGGANILDQLRLIDAIRTAGTVKVAAHGQTRTSFLFSWNVHA
jgi:hypothetical protein